MSSNREYFYHGTIKKMTAVFSSLFKGIQLKRSLPSGTVYVEVPVRFAQKQKTRDANKTYPDLDISGGFAGAAAMISFEMVDLQFAADRTTSQFNRFAGSDASSYNRVPYDIVFNTYVTATKLDDALQIIEQILPFFSPAVNVSIDDGEFGVSKIPIILNSVGTELNYEGLVSENRTIVFTLIFTMKAWLYRNETNVAVINKTIVNIGDLGLPDNIYFTSSTEVSPRTNDPSDEFELIKTETDST